MAFRPDEQAIAEELASALRAGSVVGLPSFQYVSWRPNPQDPPDLLIDLDGKELGIELGRVVGEDYARIRRRPPRLHAWSSEPEVAVEQVFRKKAESYTQRGLRVDWLLFHNSLVEVPGFYTGGLEWHRHLRSSKARLFATGPFEKVLLQSEWKGHSWWSVLFATDGRQIETPAEARLHEWHQRLQTDERVLADEIVVDDRGELDVFPIQGPGLLVFQESGLTILKVVLVGSSPRYYVAALTYSGWLYRVWLPCKSKADAHALESDLTCSSESDR